MAIAVRQLRFCAVFLDCDSFLFRSSMGSPEDHPLDALPVSRWRYGDVPPDAARANRFRHAPRAADGVVPETRATEHSPFGNLTVDRDLLAKLIAFRNGDAALPDASETAQAAGEIVTGIEQSYRAWITHLIATGQKPTYSE
jgi:hypothetical protein